MRVIPSPGACAVGIEAPLWNRSCLSVTLGGAVLGHATYRFYPDSLSGFQARQSLYTECYQLCHRSVSR